MGVPSLERGDEIEEKIAKEEAEKLRKIMEKERSEPAVVKGKESKKKDIPDIVEILADKVSEKYGIDRDSVIKVYRELAEESDDDIEKIVKLSKIGKLAEEATNGSELVKSIKNVAISSALHKYSSKVLADGDGDDISNIMNSIDRRLRKLLPLIIEFRIVDRVLGAMFGNGNGPKRTEKDTDDVAENIVNNIMSMVEERISGIEEKINSLLEEKQRERKEREKRRMVRSILKIGKSVESIVKRIENLEREIEVLKKAGADSEDIRRKENSLREMINKVKEAVNDAKELLKEMGYKVNEPGSDEGKNSTEIPKQSEMDEIIKEYLKDPSKIVKFVESLASLVNRFKKTWSNVESGVGSAKEDESSPPSLEEKG